MFCKELSRAAIALEPQRRKERKVLQKGKTLRRLRDFALTKTLRWV